MAVNNLIRNPSVGNRALVLMLGAGAVAVVRYVGVALHAEGSPVHGWLWDAVNGASGAGMAVLEAVGIWHAWEAWSTAQPSRNRNVLMGLIVAMFASLVTMTTPYVFSASQKSQTAATLVQLAPTALWLWSLAVAAAPLLVMASAGMADTLLKTSRATEPDRDTEQVVAQAVAGAVNALRGEFDGLHKAHERDNADLRRGLQVVAGQLQALQTQQDDATEAQPVAQLASGDVMEWKEALQHLAGLGEDATPTRMAQLTGLNKSTTSRRLKAVQS